CAAAVGHGRRRARRAREPEVARRSTIPERRGVGLAALYACRQRARFSPDLRPPEGLISHRGWGPRRAWTPRGVRSPPHSLVADVDLDVPRIDVVAAVIAVTAQQEQDQDDEDQAQDDEQPDDRPSSAAPFTPDL